MSRLSVVLTLLSTFYQWLKGTPSQNSPISPTPKVRKRPAAKIAKRKKGSADVSLVLSVLLITLIVLAAYEMYAAFHKGSRNEIQQDCVVSSAQ
jgi:hypothetical protein